MWVELHDGDCRTATNRRPWLRRDGRHIWLEDSCLRRPDRPDGERILVILLGATARIAQEEALQQREAELVQREAEKSALADQMEALARDFRLLADEVPAAVFRCDASG